MAKIKEIIAVTNDEGKIVAEAEPVTDYYRSKSMNAVGTYSAKTKDGGPVLIVTVNDEIVDCITRYEDRFESNKFENIFE